MNLEVIVIFLVFAIARVFDSISTVLLLKNNSSLEEAMRIPRYLQEKFGLIRGEAIVSSLVIIILLPILVLSLYSNQSLFLGWLLSGVYLGFSLKQLQIGLEYRTN